MLKHAECETSLFIRQVSLPGLNYIPFSTSCIFNKTICLQCRDTLASVSRGHLAVKLDRTRRGAVDEYASAFCLYLIWP